LYFKSNKLGHIFFYKKKNYNTFYFFIELLESHNLNHWFDMISQVDLTLIIMIISLSLLIFLYYFFYLIIISKHIFLSKTIYFCKKARPTLLVQTNKTFEVKGNLKKQTQASTNPTKLIPTWMTVANLVYLKVY
jgi:hypothetical protein